MKTGVDCGGCGRERLGDQDLSGWYRKRCSGNMKDGPGTDRNQSEVAVAHFQVLRGGNIQSQQGSVGGPMVSNPGMGILSYISP